MASTATVVLGNAPPRSNKSIYMVLGGTVFAAAAQVLLKFAAAHPMPPMSPADTSSWMPFLAALLGNYQLLLGYTSLACNSLLLILALKDGQLSLLYPIIGLTYVWVVLLSMYFFHEQINLWKGVGSVLIIGGVSLLGWASSRS